MIRFRWPLPNLQGLSGVNTFVLHCLVYHWTLYLFLLLESDYQTRQQCHMSHSTTKTNKMTCVPSKDLDQHGHPPSLIRVFACAVWVAKDARFFHADSEDSDQTGRMPRLIWVFDGRKGHFVCFVTWRLICLSWDVCCVIRCLVYVIFIACANMAATFLQMQEQVTDLQRETEILKDANEKLVKR